MTTPKQDLTERELDEFRRELIGYDIEGNANCHLSDANVERLIAAARKGIEAQKPEPSGERGEYQHPDTSAPYTKQYDVPSKSSYAPSPTPGDKDDNRADSVSRRAGLNCEPSGGQLQNGLKPEPSPSGSVEGLAEEAFGYIDYPLKALSAYLVEEDLHKWAGDLEEAITVMSRTAEALKRMEQERDNARKDVAELTSGRWHNVADTDEISRLSLEVGRLKSAAQWAIPLAEIALENHRTGRIKAGHADIRGKHADGRLVIGLWQDEIDEWDAARNALAGGAEK